jgi:hypothetical protein
LIPLENNPSSNTQTIFNSAQAGLERIHLALARGNFFKEFIQQSGHEVEGLKGWFGCLQTVIAEISPKMTRTERQKIREIALKFKELKPLKERVYNRQTYDFEIVFNQQELQKRMSLYTEYEWQLRKIADVHGMLVPDKQENEVADDER